jgi:glycine/D-amino acid oxidase-like deaminating enzyme
MSRTAPNGAPKHRSLWLREALADASPAPVLVGSDRADVAIAGGGLVGLWTALAIKERDPACDVVILEQDVCGGGASGRNGGMVLSWWPKLASLVKLVGEQEALRLGRASEGAIEELRAFCERHEIDCRLRRGGFLWTATTPAQIGAWDAVLRLTEKLGVEPLTRLAPADVARRSGSAAHLAGVFEPRAATVQPALLVRGVRRVALEAGVRIFEGSRMVSFTRERPLAITSDGG